VPALVRLTVEVPRAEADRAMAEACAALGTGCRERALPGGRVALDFWVAPPGDEPVALLERAVGGAVAGGVRAEAEDPSWRDAMRAFHRPVEIAGRLRVRPPWDVPRPPLADVVIDPGMAFGTAQHPTTRACLELLAGLPAAGSLLDAGCGSGVLAIAARRLGFDPVWAFDHDPLAVEATLANERRNRVGLRVARRTIGADALPVAGVVVANLTATVLAVLAGALPHPAPLMLVASGLHPHEVSAAAAGFAPLGLSASREIVDDGWVTLLLERP
jgi:ribosomal protein L11 methyltransferase